MHSKAVRKPLVAIILSILKCMFYNRTISPSTGGRGGQSRLGPSKSANGTTGALLSSPTATDQCTQLLDTTQKTRKFVTVATTFFCTKNLTNTENAAAVAYFTYLQFPKTATVGTCGFEISGQTDIQTRSSQYLPSPKTAIADNWSRS